MEKKKVLIITGSSQGIGYATAKYFNANGYTVYGIALEDAKDKSFISYCANVCDCEQISKIFEEVYNKEGRIDVVINNAGMGISGAIEYATEKDIDKIFNVNIKAVVNISRIAIPYLRKTKGKIINTSSVASVMPIPFQACYTATKSAVEGFSFALANEVKPFGIKVTCVRPGDTKTGFTAARVKTEVVNNEYGERIKKSVMKMEKDEQNGKDPITVSKLMYKVAKKKKPPLVCTVGFEYKLICLLEKILPKKFINYIISKLY